MQKEKKCKDHKPKLGKLLRKKSLKSVGSFMNRIVKTLITLTQFGDADAREAEDDDGGFRKVAPSTESADPGTSREEADNILTSSPLCAGRDRLLYKYGDQVPGVMGLKNHGNTCFMNAVVQCLSNTDVLAEYLGLKRYKHDLVRTGLYGVLISEEMRHAKGEVTEQLATLVRALWTLEYTPQLSVDFKTVVSKYGSQFRGNFQHDALEFLLWLLDRVHEDVNLDAQNNNDTIKALAKGDDGGEEVQHPGQSQPQQDGLQHSFVKEHFQAQYKSSLTCPHCQKQSNTFDPFLCISLPIPLCQTRLLCVILVFSNKGQRYLRVRLAVPLFGSVACLRRMVADEGKLSPDQVILTEVYSIGFCRSFFDDEDVSSIAEHDVIYAFQAPALYIRGGSAKISGFHHSLPSSPYSTGPVGQRLLPSGTLSSEFLNQGVPVKILLLVCNAAGAGQHAVRFGPPFLMREDRSISWDQLQQSILSKMYYLMINGTQAQNSRVLFNIRVVAGSGFYNYLSPKDKLPLYHPAVDGALKLCGSGGPPHVKLIIEWEHRIKDCLFGNIQEEVVKDAENVRNRQQHIHQYSCTLDECFYLYTKEEQLAPDDAWKCPHCKQLQQGMVKMSLWTLPDILILHLKRFTHVGEHRNKLTTFVHFPLNGLDMAPHMVNHSHLAHQPPLASWNDCSRRELIPPDFLYDLYAVCNHHGGMHGGHYTAFCRNSVDGQWYSYDDSSTEAVPEAEVCTREAYILFYQRRNTIPSWSASSSVTGSTSSSTSDHWLIRLAGASERGSVVSAEPFLGPSITETPESVEHPVFGDEATETSTDEFETRQIVRTQARSMSMRSPANPKEALCKNTPLRWSFSSKDHIKSLINTQPGELVKYLESGRRPRCTKDPITKLVASPPPRISQGKSQGEGQDPPLSNGHLGCSERPASETHPSAAVQARSNSLCHGNKVKAKDSGSSRQRSSRRTKSPQGRTADCQHQLQRATVLGSHCSHSAPSSRESTLRNTESGGTYVAQKDMLQLFRHSEGRRAQKGHGDSSQDTVFPALFFKPFFMKKDIPGSAEVQYILKNSQGQLGKMANIGQAKLSLSNGMIPNVVLEDKKVGVLSRCNHHSCSTPLQAGKPRPTDVQWACSSCNIQSRLDQTFQKCASLQRNGEALPVHVNLLLDKPSYTSLQQIRQSTASLGRTVTESSF